MRRPRHNRRSRGAALVETVLVAPLLVTLLLISLYVTDLIRAKLKLQEAARHAVWEMTSYTLSDYGAKNHGNAFDLARNAAQLEALERFGDLDSVDVGGRLGMAVTTEGFEVELTQLGVDLGNAGYAPNLDEGWSTDVQSAAGDGLSSALQRYGFNQTGRVQAQVRARVRSAILPRSYLDGPGGWFQTDFSAFDVVDLSNRYTMIVDGWDLHDGADAMIRNQRAGMHASDDSVANGQHGLHRQVSRMTYLGACDDVLSFNWVLKAALSVLPNLWPNQCGTYVVSHNYMRAPGYLGWRRSSDCGYSTYPTDAAGGLNNLQATSVIDSDRLRCYDTAPFRDTWTYGDSAYLKMFRARGPNFMGCEQPQADNPAEANGLYADDENATPLGCSDGNDFE